MFHLLRQKNTFLGYAKHERSYVIGFKKHRHADLVRRNAPYSPLILLERKEVDDVSKQVNEGILPYGLEVMDLTIDTAAKLTITKDELKPSDVDLDHFQLIVKPNEMFMGLPFDQGIGIIMPYELLYDTPHEYVFLSQVIDPCVIPALFRKRLDRKDI